MPLFTPQELALLRLSDLVEDQGDEVPKYAKKPQTIQNRQEWQRAHRAKQRLQQLAYA